MLKLAQLAALMPASLLVALSFFVLFAVTKTPQRWLKIFGGLAAGLLIFAAAGSLAKAAQGGIRFRQPLPAGGYYEQLMRSQSAPVASKAAKPASSCKKCQENQIVPTNK